jgi:hypothetical protein
MRSKLFDSPNFLALLVLLAVDYAIGYWLGIGLTGSVLVALALAFGLSCVSMMGVVMLAPRAFDDESDRREIG